MEPLLANCPKCGGTSKEWNCYCTFGCDACGINNECTKCGHRYNVRTPEQEAKFQRKRLQSKAASKAKKERRLDKWVKQ